MRGLLGTEDDANCKCRHCFEAAHGVLTCAVYPFLLTSAQEPRPALRHLGAWIAQAILWLILASCGPDSSQAPSSGISYYHDRVDKVPTTIHVVKAERARADLELRTTLGKEAKIGLNTLVQQIHALPPEAGLPLAAINGDFYVVDERNPYAGDPRGLQILDGELVSAPTDQASFWIDAAGVPQATNVLSRFEVTWPDGGTTPIGLNEERVAGAAVLYTARQGQTTRTRGGRELILDRAGSGPWLPLRAGLNYAARIREARAGGNSGLGPDVMVLSLSLELLTNTAAAAHAEAGAVLNISMATVPDLTGVKSAISGGYVLVRDGKTETLRVPSSADYKYASITQRHPRSAIGASRDYLFLVQVDGRQPGYSMGMTLAELGDYMQKLGCEVALSLDGGASATFWWKGKIMNRPCNGAARPIANGVVILKKPPARP